MMSDKLEMYVKINQQQAKRLSSKLKTAVDTIAPKGQPRFVTIPGFEDRHFHICLEIREKDMTNA